MKLSAWAKKQGVGYRAARNMFRRGEIPLACKLPAGTIIIPEEETVGKPDYVVCHAGVSSSQNKKEFRQPDGKIKCFPCCFRLCSQRTGMIFFGTVRCLEAPQIFSPGTGRRASLTRE